MDDNSILSHNSFQIITGLVATHEHNRVALLDPGVHWAEWALLVRRQWDAG